MSTLSRRGPNANTPAKLPGIQTARIGDANTRQAVEALREWVEVRLGSRGDPFERAATQRDLSRLVDRIVVLESSVGAASEAGGASGSSTISASLATPSRTVNTLQQDVLARTGAVAATAQTLRNDLSAVLTRLGLVEEQVVALTTSLFDEFTARRNVFTAAQTTDAEVVELYDTGSGMEAYPDGSVSTTFYVLATDDFELNPPSAMSDGTTYTIVVQQDDIGGHTPHFGAGFAFDGVAPPFGASPGEMTVVTGVAITGFFNGELRQVLAATVQKGFDLSRVQTVGVSRGAGAATGRTLGPYTWLSTGIAAGSSVATGAT